MILSEKFNFNLSFVPSHERTYSAEIVKIAGSFAFAHLSRLFRSV